MCKDHDGTPITFEVRKLLAKLNDIESEAEQWSKKTMVNHDGKPIWYYAEKAKYLEKTNHTMKSQERLIDHIERRFREEQEGRRDAETLLQAKDELDKAKKTIRQLEDTVKSLQEVLQIYKPSV
ncbi:hypothetical protein BpHYR1_035604 [Brachionus plicatilis]|uniref:Uncharacterized protein n=1 Tax=Brachionus plicatilis TaxID=10195 RepID=A0A3M7R1V0_BRAPC|nr:hypothetical protein BpHYR1_035604 [Brachionus plicatilis]